jgi:hypothetical protein
LRQAKAKAIGWSRSGTHFGLSATQEPSMMRSFISTITQERYTHTLPGELEQARAAFDRWLEQGSEIAAEV